MQRPASFSAAAPMIAGVRHSCVLMLAGLSLLTAGTALGQSSPARGPLPAQSAQSTQSDDIPLADYLGLLQQIAPAAEEGARAYLAVAEQRCGRKLSSAELRRAMSQGDGDPMLMGMIRASHLKDAAARDQLATQIRCPARGSR